MEPYTSRVGCAYQQLTVRHVRRYFFFITMWRIISGEGRRVHPLQGNISGQVLIRTLRNIFERVTHVPATRPQRSPQLDFYTLYRFRQPDSTSWPLILLAPFPSQTGSI